MTVENLNQIIRDNGLTPCGGWESDTAVYSFSAEAAPGTMGGAKLTAFYHKPTGRLEVY